MSKQLITVILLQNCCKLKSHKYYIHVVQDPIFNFYNFWPEAEDIFLFWCFSCACIVSFYITNNHARKVQSNEHRVYRYFWQSVLKFCYAWVSVACLTVLQHTPLAVLLLTLLLFFDSIINLLYFHLTEKNQPGKRKQQPLKFKVGLGKVIKAVSSIETINVWMYINILLLIIMIITIGYLLILRGWPQKQQETLYPYSRGFSMGDRFEFGSVDQRVGIIYHTSTCICCLLIHEWPPYVWTRLHVLRVLSVSNQAIHVIVGPCPDVHVYGWEGGAYSRARVGLRPKRSRIWVSFTKTNLSTSLTSCVENVIY